MAGGNNKIFAPPTGRAAALGVGRRSALEVTHGV
jgi:hypothetical protein